MAKTGRMAYGDVPHHVPHHTSRWVVALRLGIAVAVVLLLVATSGWVQQNSRRFDSETNGTLCKLLKDGC